MVYGVKEGKGRNGEGRDWEREGRRKDVLKERKKSSKYFEMSLGKEKEGGGKN